MPGETEEEEEPASCMEWVTAATAAAIVSAREDMSEGFPGVGREGAESSGSLEMGSKGEGTVVWTRKEGTDSAWAPRALCKIR
jgi:hypothetical protein